MRPQGAEDVVPLEVGARYRVTCECGAVFYGTYRMGEATLPLLTGVLLIEGWLPTPKFSACDPTPISRIENARWERLYQ